MRKLTLVLVMKLTIQSRAFADFLKTSLDCETRFISNEMELENLDRASNPLLLVDVANLPNIDDRCWQIQFDTNLSQVHTVLLNTLAKLLRYFSKIISTGFIAAGDAKNSRR
jgi:hypothetical protein